MKLTNTKTRKSNKGMTLIELTVVILVLLSLISVLFIGARAWMKGSDRANSALLIRNAQQGVRSHANIMGIESLTTAIPYAVSGDWLKENIFGPPKFVETTVLGTEPTHPAANSGHAFGPGSNDWETIPSLSELYMTSTGPEAAFYTPNL